MNADALYETQTTGDPIFREVGYYGGSKNFLPGLKNKWPLYIPAPIDCYRQLKIGSQASEVEVEDCTNGESVENVSS